jgi:DNA recombination protein RmuC
VCGFLAVNVILEITLAFIVGALVGGFSIFKLLPGFLNSIFRETARSELSEIQQEVTDQQKEDEDDIKKRLQTLDDTINSAKQTWTTSATGLATEVRDLTKSHAKWTEALSNPGEQGALAEESLKVMLQTAGFVEGVNFAEQQTATTEEGKYRPDVYVYTIDEGVIIIDSKAPVKLYKEAIETEDKAQKKKKLKQHANNVLEHAKSLGRKDYSQAVKKTTPDFVIMYMPNVSIYMSAVEQIPDIVEQAAKHRVMICPPSLVYAALKTIMLTWNQQKVYENAENIKIQATELHTRLRIFYEFFFGIGDKLKSAVDSYNKGLNSWEKRLMPKIRQIEDMGIADSTRKIESATSVEVRPNLLRNEDNTNDDG